MKDIDFDELDKAVNSLMGGIKDKTDQPVPKTLNISTTLKENEAPEYTKLEQVAQKIGSETIGGPTERTAILSGTGEDATKILNLASEDTVGKLAVPPTLPVAAPVSSIPVRSGEPAKTLARRPSGRFMDVMSPSSDMKTTAGTAPAPPLATSREGMAITPPARPMEPVAEPMAVEPEPKLMPSFEETPAPTAKAPFEPVTEPPAEPLSSPFLQDAKVEKRPLGAAAPAALPEASLAPEQPIAAEEPKKDTQLAPGVTETVEPELPEELNNNLLAIETNLATEETFEDEQPAAEHSIPPAPVELLDQKTPEPAIGAASIPQQYRELPNTGDQSTGSIFDVDDYHKQPAHPPKSGQSWLWIVIIVGIIVVCGAGAVAFYLLSAK